MDADILAQLDELQAHFHLLTPEEQVEAAALIERLECGRLTKYITNLRKPLPKQRLFLSMEQKEVMYGGAAGGGKSDAILMGALQYVDRPHYRALILRRTYQDLALPEALMHRAHEWLNDSDAVWRGKDYSWVFPSGASITFGYLDSPKDKYRYASAAFQYIGFDELTQFREEDYTFLFSRLRKTAAHGNIPLRVRSASNPGGDGHEWVKERFIPDEYSRTSVEERFARVWKKGRRYFIPARMEDNTYLDQAGYDESLQELGATQRAQLRFGDWDAVTAGMLFRLAWLRDWSLRGDCWILDDGTDRFQVDPRHVEVFITADTASTKNNTSDWTVIAVWALDLQRYNLLLLDLFRGRLEVPDIPAKITQMYRTWDCKFALIEHASSGIGVLQELRRGGKITVKDYSPQTGDKISRSTTAQVRMEKGQIWLPPKHRTDWRKDFDLELLSFPVGQYDDQVDVVSMAAAYANTRDRIYTKSARPTPLFYPNPARGR